MSQFLRPGLQFKASHAATVKLLAWAVVLAGGCAGKGVVCPKLMHRVIGDLGPWPSKLSRGCLTARHLASPGGDNQGRVKELDQDESQSLVRT